MAPRSSSADHLGTSRPLAAAGADAPRGPRNAGRGRAPRRPRRGPRRQPPGDRAPRPRGQLQLGLCPGAPTRDPPARVAGRGDELPFLRARPRGPLPDAPEPAAAAVPLGRDRGPRFSRADPGRPRARGAALRGRGLARRQRAAEVARRGARGAAGHRRRRDLDPVRPRRERTEPGNGRRTVLHGALPRHPEDEGRGGPDALSRGRGENRSAPRVRRAHVLGVRRCGQRASPRLRGRGRLLPPRELARVPPGDSYPRPLSLGAGRPVPAGRGPRTGAPRRAARSRVPRHVRWRPHRVRLGAGALAAALLGRGAGDRLARPLGAGSVAVRER